MADTHAPRWMAVTASLALASLALGQAAPEVIERYDAHRVVRVHAKSPREVMAATALTNDIWTCTGVGVGTFDVRMSPEQYAAFAGLGVAHDVMIPDVQALIDAETRRLGQAGAPDGDWYDDYRSLADHNARLDAIAAAHPNLTEIVTVSQSVQGRTIRGIRITGPNNPGDRPVIVINGGQHAREWISPAACMFFIEDMLEKYATDPAVRRYVDNIEFYIVPMLNPDGYHFTRPTAEGGGGQRLWRKNRQPPPQGSTCFGVDLNRNWSYEWGRNNGSSGLACNDTYRGSAPLSEPEASGFAAFFSPLAARIVAHIDVHSYAQKILTPWGFTTEPPSNYPLYEEVGTRMERAIEDVYGTPYDHGQGSVILYVTSGTIVDWAHVALDCLSWTIELRDTGQFGFVLPPEQIIPTGVETAQAFYTLSDWVVPPPLIMSFEEVLPRAVRPHRTTNLGVRIDDGTQTLLAGSETLWHRISGGTTFTSEPLSVRGGGLYDATLPAALCGDVIEFYIEAQTTQGATHRLPEIGFVAIPAQSIVVTYFDDMETNLGWTVGAPGDTATAGVWNRMDPEPTAAQPGDDHTPPPGVNCWVTDGRAGSSIGQYDVDNGSTTLTSPIFDATGGWDIIFPVATLTYHRWYSNDRGANPNTNSMPIRLSNDGGQTWVDLEVVTENANAWVRKEFRVADFLTPTETMRLRVVARDDTGAIVEAALDDVELVVIGCPRHPADFDRNGRLDIFDFLAFQNMWVARDPRADLDQSTGVGVFDIFDFLEFQNLFIGPP